MSTFRSEADKIYIFKTNVKYKKDLKKIAPLFRNDPRVKDWHVDIEDVDRVLRIEADGIHVGDILNLMEKSGFFCEELND